MRIFFTLLVSILFISALSLNAQFKKGTTFLGSDFSFSTQQQKGMALNKYKVSGFTVSPVIGKATKENLILGFGLKFSITNADYDVDENNFKDKTYGLAFVARKYKQLGKNGFYLFLQGSIGVEYYTSVHAYLLPTKEEYNQLGANVILFPGVTYAISKKIQVETGLNNLLGAGYSSGKGKIGGFSPSNYTKTQFSIYSSLGVYTPLYLGFRLLLNQEIKNKEKVAVKNEVF